MNVYIKESDQQAQACVIWMHGLGADSSDMAGLADQKPIADLPLRHVFIDAPMRPITLNGGMSMPAWYDIVGMTLNDREDRQGIAESQQAIQRIIDKQIDEGFRSEQIFLAGFSQGGAMAMYTGLRFDKKLGGVIALSAYLLLASEIKPLQSKNTPFFIAGGSFDPLVLPVWTKASITWLEAQGYHDLSVHSYPMEHSVCMDEIKDIGQWLNTRI